MPPKKSVLLVTFSSKKEVNRRDKYKSKKIPPGPLWGRDAYYKPKLFGHTKKSKNNLKKVDFCVQEKTDTQFKVLLCDMDATIIANETLDDLVKLTGVKTNIDETSKLAMEGKIDLKTTLKNRVELLKGHPNSLIEEVKNGDDGSSIAYVTRG